MFILQKILNLKYKWYRLFRKNRISYPFLSGDAFTKMADFAIQAKEDLLGVSNMQRIENADVLFCKSEFLEELFKIHFHSIRARVIICGNSDFEFLKPLGPIPKSVKQLYLQNSYISDSIRIFTLPIGIENFKLGVNGTPYLMQSAIPMQDKINSILIGPFGSTHGFRLEIEETFSKISGPWLFLAERLSPKRYYTTSSKFKFIACVRGNGVDTHRLWETLYRGSIPIVLSDSWSESLQYLNLPILYVKDWKPEGLQTVINRNVQTFDPKGLESLWLPYWENRIRTST